MKPSSASPGARALSASLREARVATPLGVRELARLLDLDAQMLSQWERGTRVPPVEVVARILGYLQVDKRTSDRILHLAKHAKEPNWLDSNPSDLPQALTGIMEYERTATTITAWSLGIVPGLLQTADYARAVLGNSQISLEEADTRLVIRLDRQKILYQRDPVQLTVFVAEGAIRELVGTEDIMSDQMDHLLNAVEQQNISLRIVPLNAGYHPGMLGPFSIYEFASVSPIVYLEHSFACAFLHDAEGVGRYRALAKLLADKALSEEASQELLREAAR
jgi:transcriptional regulator with XRE-family HTH domain